MCDAEHYDATIGPGVDCLLCPVGTGCPQGAKLEELPILVGYYRLDNTSIDVRLWARLCPAPFLPSRANALTRATVFPCRCAAAPMLASAAMQTMEAV